MPEPQPPGPVRTPHTKVAEKEREKGQCEERRPRAEKHQQSMQSARQSGKGRRRKPKVLVSRLQTSADVGGGEATFH